MLKVVNKVVLLEMAKKIVMLFEEKAKIINLFAMGIQRLEMEECVLNGGQEGIVGVADLK